MTLRKSLWTISFFATFSSLANTSVELIQATNLFVPNGYDSNDLSTQIVLTGELPNTCYRLPTASVTHAEGKIEINLSATKLSSENHMCIMALVPFSLTVDLGKLSEGNYEINVNSSSRFYKKSGIQIVAAETVSVDNYTYAKVTDVHKVADTNTIKIEGFHPSSCIEMERVISIPNEKGDTFSILPIIKKNDVICDALWTPFEVLVDLSLPEGESLIHVRTMDSSSINAVVHK